MSFYNNKGPMDAKPSKSLMAEGKQRMTEDYKDAWQEREVEEAPLNTE